MSNKSVGERIINISVLLRGYGGILYYYALKKFQKTSSKNTNPKRALTILKMSA
jgi:hypothetical protein